MRNKGLQSKKVRNRGMRKDESPESRHWPSMYSPERQCANETLRAYRMGESGEVEEESNNSDEVLYRQPKVTAKAKAISSAQAIIRAFTTNAIAVATVTVR